MVLTYAFLSDDEIRTHKPRVVSVHPSESKSVKNAIVFSSPVRRAFSGHFLGMERVGFSAPAIRRGQGTERRNSLGRPDTILNGVRGGGRREQSRRLPACSWVRRKKQRERPHQQIIPLRSLLHVKKDGSIAELVARALATDKIHTASYSRRNVRCDRIVGARLFRRIK